jgi:hypothetical protein
VQFFQLVVGFHANTFSVGIQTHSFHPGQPILYPFKDIDQPFLGDDQSIPVTDKQPVLSLAIFSCKFNILKNDFIFFYVKAFSPECTAKGAFIMGTAQSDL